MSPLASLRSWDTARPRWTMGEADWLLLVRIKPFRRLPFRPVEEVDFRLEDHSLSFNNSVSLVSVVSELDNKADFLVIACGPGQL